MRRPIPASIEEMRSNSAPVMVELKSNEIVMDRNLVQSLLEETLRIEQSLDRGKTPFEAYRAAVGNAVDMFRFEKNNLSNKQKINTVQKRIALVDFYFEKFVQMDPDEKSQEYIDGKNDADLAAFETNQVALQG